MSKLEKAIVAIVEVFEECSGKNSVKQLSNAEFSALIVAQLKSPEFQDKIGQEDICQALEKMDKDHGSHVNFEDFSQSVVILAEGYAKYSRGNGTCQAKLQH